MSNRLSVRRVKVQTINEFGESLGAPSFGVMAADDYASAYIDAFEGLGDLNDAIDAASSILDVLNSDQFAEADHAKIGKVNFYGDDWMKSGTTGR